MARLIAVVLTGAFILWFLLRDRDGRAEPQPAPDPVAFDTVSSPAGPGSAEPFIAGDGQGRLYLSWLELQSDSGQALRFARLENGAWSDVRTIRAGRDFFVNWADFPSIVPLGGSSLAVHWLQRTGSGTYAYGVRVARSSDGGATWSQPITPHRDSSQVEHGFVTLWPEGSGLGAVWLDGRLGAGSHGHHVATMLMATVLDSNGVPGAETRLDARACDCCQTSVAATSQGPIIAYRDRSADEIRDIAVVRRVNGNWSEPKVPIADGWKIAACPVNGPSIAARGSRVAMAWFTAANDSPRVKLAFSDDAGASFGAPLRVDGGSPVGRVGVTITEDGETLVTWLERTAGDSAAVLLRRVSPTLELSTPRPIALSTAGRASGFPRIALSGGNAWFAWTEAGSPSRVRMARLHLGAAQ